MRNHLTQKKWMILFSLSLGLGLMGSLLIISSPRLVTATEPTVVPLPKPTTVSPQNPSPTLCHLEFGRDCVMVSDFDLAATGARSRTNPTIGARGAPTYTLISATFEQGIDPATLNPDSFYVSQGSNRVAGTIESLDSDRMAVFRPATPLRPNTTYTATLTTAVRDLTGASLAEAKVWRFTTSAAGAEAKLAVLGSNMNVYFGDLHNHTGYSDGPGIPADAFATARANGVDFLGVSEHAFMLTDTEWENLLVQAESATVEGQFVALPGVEYTGHQGHLNIFASDTFIQREDPNYDSLAEVYRWLIDHPTAIAQFNHPLEIDGLDWNFADFAYNPAADLKIVLHELQTVDQFFLALNKGWHLGTLKNRDVHDTSWGCCPSMGLVAPQLTEASLFEALRARRTFFVPPNDSNFALVLQANGAWMGSAIPYTGLINFTVTGFDPDPKGKSLHIVLYDNGTPLGGVTLPSSTSYTWTPQVMASPGHYYYVEAFHDGWWYPAYSSPIWVEQPPLAEAGLPQVVPPGAVVTLNGRASSDPDGQAVAYRWSQQAGPPVTLDQAHTDRPTFIAPNNPATEVMLRLTVTDPGGLSASDTTTVVVTDKPVLTIVKQGPAFAEVGEPISYTLTVMNLGITDAAKVVITDAVPAGATYVGGGTLMPGNIVSWTVPSLSAGGGVTQTSFVVTTDQGIINSDYRASCPDCINAAGQVEVFTNGRKLYLPIIAKP